MQLDNAGVKKGPMTVVEFYAILQKIADGKPDLPIKFLERAHEESNALKAIEGLTSAHFNLLTAMNLMTIVRLDEEVDLKACELMEKMSEADWNLYFAARVEAAFGYLPKIVAAKDSTDGSLRFLLKEAQTQLRRLLCDFSAPEWTAPAKVQPVKAEPVKVESPVVTPKAPSAEALLAIGKLDAQYQIELSEQKAKLDRHKKSKKKSKYYSASDEDDDMPKKGNRAREWEDME